MTWNKLFDQYLLNPQKIEKPKEENLFCISLLFCQEEWDIHPLELLSEIRIFKATIVHNIPKPHSINGHDLGLTIFYPDGQKTILTALKIEKRFTRKLRVSISYGLGLTLESHKSLHAFQAEKLNHFTNHNELTLTDKAKKEVVLPDGIGAFQASKQQAEFVGFPFWILKDYR